MFRVSLFLLYLFASGAKAGSVEENYWDKWPVITVPIELQTPKLLTIHEKWTFECGLDSEELIGKIVAAASGGNGDVLLLDGQQTKVLVLSPNGKVKRVLGQAGEGPGDFPGSYKVLQLSDGRIGVCGGAPAMTFLLGGSGKIVFLDKADDPAGVWLGVGDPGTMPVVTIRELRCSNDRILTAGHGIVFSKEKVILVQELALLEAPDGQRTVVAENRSLVDMSSSKIHERDNFEPFAFGRCDVSHSGRLAFAPDRDLWRIVVRNIDGTGFVLQRPWTSRKRTSEQKEIIWKNLGGIDDCVVLEFDPAVARIRWRPNGNLWVESFGLNPGAAAIACFEEFSSTGEYLRRIQIPLHGGGPSDKLCILEDGRFILLRGFNSEEGNPNSSSAEDAKILESAVVLFSVK